MSVVNIVIGEKYYNKDPRSSDLGGRIVSESISLMAALGFENFTFLRSEGFCVRETVAVNPQINCAI
jgi:hypothetical protein